ncbi:ABC transporter permease [Cellulomonas gilvus]|uniref:Binding-protein-dependent transport systems inner membrane component n=1 Tax=Cellulomonas gilvus (strain ATCC 13127 / NRRL B-14078) TaxID=593907 RepID=F8A744_CELGA|nr:ABC transporter permease subunit [Cellulomonas gilvus]AEI13531.1 binding-protein-dependent transport systems inner membrane component [Cellulomonas gilvus ATCC 13127]
MTATTTTRRAHGATQGDATPTASGRGRAPRSGWGGLGWTVAVALPLAFLLVFFAYPVATMVGRGFVVDGRLDLSGFADVFGRPRTWRIIGQTLAQAGVATTVSVLLGVPGAYVLHRHRFPGRAAVRALVTVPFVLPTVVVGVAFRSLLVEGGPLGFLHLDGTFVAIVAALVFFNYAVVVRGVGGLWERLDPRAEQAARALGATPWRAFRTVTLPALTPAIASAASLAFLFCATAFGTVLVLGGLRFGTVETEIWVQTTQFLDLRAAAVLSVVQLVVVGAALTVAGRARGRRERALHLAEPELVVRPLRLRRPAGTPRHDGHALLLAATGVTALVVVLLALPLVNLVVRSLRVGDGWGLDHYRALGTVGGGVTVTVWQAALTSLRTAVDATVLALVVGGLVALVVSRRPRRPAARRAVAGLDALFMLPLGVSAVTVGFGFLLAMHEPLGLPLDLRRSPLLVPVAQAVVAVPLVVRTVLPVLRAIDPRLREAAATLGAAPGRVLRTVDLALAARSIGLAAGFAFAASLGEFGATSFLARPENPTLPVVVFRLIGRPGPESYGMALAASVVLAALTAAVVALCERLRRTGDGGEW